MRVLCHIDPLVLEREALRRLDEAAGRGDRVLLIVASRRLGDHVQRRMVERRAAWARVQTVDLGRLPSAVLERETDAAPRPLTDRLRAALVERALAEAGPDNAWTTRAAGRPGAVRRVRAAFDDLREAGIGATDLAEAARHDGDRDLADVMRRYERILAALARAGAADTAGRAGAACRVADRFATRFDTVLLHGAYEVIGAHLALLRAIDARTPVTALVPAHRAGRGTLYARRFAESHLGAGGAPVEWLPGEPGREERLAALYDEQARPGGAPPWTVACANAQGAAAEVRYAVRRALAAIDDGCPAEEILLVARDPASHLAAFEESLGEAGIPWSTSARSPLRREPIVRDLLLLLRTVAESFPRGATVELLRSPRLRLGSLCGGRHPAGDRLDTLSRAARLLGGIDEWRETLPAWLRARAGDATLPDDLRERHAATLERDLADAGATADALAALAARLVADERRPWRDHAAGIADLLDAVAAATEEDDGRRGGARRALEECLRDMAALDDLLGDAGGVPFERARRWLEDAVDGYVWSPDGDDRGGLRVLDAMQSRGLTARRVAILGMNSGAFPRRGAPDPVLDDDLRRRLRERTGRPLPVGAERVEEERGLLALLLGAAVDAVDISWQRSDDGGRARSPSLALREIARLAVGRPAPETLPVVHLSSHPLEWLDGVERLTGVLSPDDEAVQLALRARGPGAPGLEARHPELADGLAMLRVTEAFRHRDRRFDGLAGGASPRVPLSVSSLERLGGCPLRFFFERVLRLRELDDAATPWELDPRETGTIAHVALHRLYARLQADGVFDAGDADSAARAAAAGVAEAFDAAAGPPIARLRGRLPVLWNRHREAWIEALQAFVEDDVRRLVRGGFRPVGFERRAEAELDFEGRRVTVRGTFDREFVGPDGRVVGDYKTARTVRIPRQEMLRGRRLQVPLYHAMAGGGAAVELMRIGPEWQRDDKTRFRFDGFEPSRPKPGESPDRDARVFAATMATLLDLVERGRYPLRPHERECARCPFERGCRRLHVPTVDRERSTPAGAAVAGLGVAPEEEAS